MDKKLLSVFPFITNSVQLFEDQNRFLKKIILTGKISALEKAANLFTFTEKTIETFNDLKEELIPLLIRENVKKFTEELTSKAQISIDILIRNLFERTADVGFLATDSEIIGFLHGDVTPDSLRKRLIEYTLKYSVYDEIIITDTSGKVLLSMSGQLDHLQSHDPIIAKALKSDSYVEQYLLSDLSPSHPKTLLFAQRIVEKSTVLGVLILQFRFDDEMKRIFGSLLNPGENIVFTDDKQIVASSNNDSMTCKGVKHFDQSYMIKNDYLLTSAMSKGYEGYYGARWHSIAYINVRKMSESAPKKDPVSQKCTLDDGIKAIIKKADDVIEDLSDVIINGELIASKERVYVLTPVLDNLRTVSSSILDTIKETVSNLENTIMEGLIYEVEASAKLGMEIMDRNLYERANDCRWWALTPTFESELSSDTPSHPALNSILSYINSLYTVYTNLFIYDRHSTIVASSHDQSILGKKITLDYCTKTLSNNNAQYYFVSPFEKTPFYENNATYIYNATIRHQGKSVGGIGIVFDAEPQFKAILNDSFPLGKKGFSCFIDRKGMIIATNHPSLQAGEFLELQEEVLRFNAMKPIHRFFPFEEKKYLVGIAISAGYREYKKEDNYKNDLLSLTFIEY